MTYQLRFTISEPAHSAPAWINYRLFALPTTHVGEAQRLHWHGYAIDPRGPIRVNYCKSELFKMYTIA
ncbi:hypothetical protein ABH38_02810 [Mycobacterium haemophilum]|uniref:Uncharacterized protein n=1 Tax=Mycobacterium haemophilum TaxID=29311 RepID=A0A0I9UAN7_9MYCO|nr:hypothetical protein ABH38_02810 [Mycobacterium haemophilum]